jgi:hypothetical protein
MLQQIPRTQMRLSRLGTFNGNEQVEMAVRNFIWESRSHISTWRAFLNPRHVSTRLIALGVYVGNPEERLNFP